MEEKSWALSSVLYGSELEVVGGVVSKWARTTLAREFPKLGNALIAKRGGGTKSTSARGLPFALACQLWLPKRCVSTGRGFTRGNIRSDHTAPSCGQHHDEIDLCPDVGMRRRNSEKDRVAFSNCRGLSGVGLGKVC